MIAIVLAPAAHDQSLPGPTITNNSFTYNSPDGQVTGIIRMPSGSGPFPAVLISHGKGGSAGGFSLQHANILVDWGFACIGPSYTHEGNSINHDILIGGQGYGRTVQVTPANGFR